MRETVTTLLDVAGLLLVAAGLGFFLWPFFGGAALVFPGGLIMVVSALAVHPVRLRLPRRRPRGKRRAANR